MPLKRQDVKPERKWNLDSLFVNETDWQATFDEVKALAPTIAKYDKHLSLDNAHLCLKELSALSRKAERVYMYAALRRDEDTANPKYQAMAEKAEMLLVELGSIASFVTPQLSKMPLKTLKTMLALPQYSDFTTLIDAIIREKKHILSDKEEKLLSEVSAFSRDFKQIFSVLDNADIKFDPITDEKGKTVELSHGMYSALLQNSDVETRKKAFESYYKSYIALQNTIAATYAGCVKKNCTIAKLRGYKSAMSMALYSESISDKVYDNLISAVKKATPSVHKYVALRKKALKLKELHMYDMYVPLTQEYDLSLDYDEAYKLVREALAPLGEDYGNLLKKAYSERWIDVEETENKRSGAYSWGCYDSNPFVLLNYQKNSHDVFTIAHELGHSMHSYMSNHAQCYDKAGYEIFVAEIASTVNEVLLLKYLLKDAEGEKRKYLLSYYLDMFRTTLFRQTMFAEFEKFAHGQIEQGIPLTAESMNAEYLKLNKEYYGDAVIHDEQIASEWSRIPHFYTAFYVYKYATGLTSAINIVCKLSEDKNFVKKYFDFLSAGGSMRPLEILALVDIDLTKTAPFEVAMREFKATLKELKELI